MTDTQHIHQRAEQLVGAAGRAALSIVHLDSAIALAREARADLGVINQMENARATITTAIHRAELQRRRLLRKADRKGAASHA